MMEVTSSDTIKEIVHRAIEVAQEVPEAYRVAVFEKFFDIEFATRDNKKQRRNLKTAEPHNRHSSRKPRTSAGPERLAEQLIDQGFFDEPRTVEAFAKQLNLKFARSFRSKDLSKPLIRLVRKGKLQRVETADGGFAYLKQS